MGPVIVILLVLVAAGMIAALYLMSRRRPAPDDVDVVTPAGRPSDPPMTGLESALAHVTDRDGRPIGERIDAESGHVDELRVPDDTGPLLRRALDHVTPADDENDPGATDADELTA